MPPGTDMSAIDLLFSRLVYTISVSDVFSNRLCGQQLLQTTHFTHTKYILTLQVYFLIFCCAVLDCSLFRRQHKAQAESPGKKKK